MNKKLMKLNSVIEICNISPKTLFSFFSNAGKAILLFQQFIDYDDMVGSVGFEPTITRDLDLRRPSLAAFHASPRPQLLSK